jgi:hypothetical protein
MTIRLADAAEAKTREMAAMARARAHLCIEDQRPAALTTFTLLG